MDKTTVKVELAVGMEVFPADGGSSAMVWAMDSKTITFMRNGVMATFPIPLVEGMFESGEINVH